MAEPTLKQGKPRPAKPLVPVATPVAADGIVKSPKAAAAAAKRKEKKGIPASAPKSAAAAVLPSKQKRRRPKVPTKHAIEENSDNSAGSDAGSAEDWAATGAGAGGTGAAWSDSDDEGVMVNVATQARLRKLRKTEDDVLVAGKEYADRLRKRFAQTHGAPEWATLDREAEEDGVGFTGPLVGKSSALPKDLLETVRQVDANHQEPSKAVIQSVQFHPSGQLMLTAGYDQKLRLFQVCDTVLVMWRVAAVMCAVSAHGASHASRCAD